MEDISGNLLCGCPELRLEHCPKRDMLTLHTISCMPKAVRRAVVTKINFTRKGPGGRKWQPSKDAVICNVHYLDCKGPSKENANVIPVHFKRPSHPTLSTPKRRRVQQQAALVAMEPSSRGVQTNLDTVYAGGEDTIIENQSSIRVREDTLLTTNPESPLAENLDMSDIQNPEASSTGEQEISHIEDAGNQDTLNSPHTEDRCMPRTEDTSCTGVQDASCNEGMPCPNINVNHSGREGNDASVELLILRNRAFEEENEHLSIENNILKQQIVKLESNLQSLTDKLLSDAQLKMYTGVDRKVFNSLLAWLQPVIKPKKDDSHLLMPSQKLLMVLMRIHMNLTLGDLTCRFAVDQSTVSRTLHHWIPMLSTHLKPLIQWPKTNVGPTVPPYDLLPNSVGIIDGTEVFIQRPSNLETQKSSYSDYKSHTTVKYLVAIDTFTGVFTFVSSGFSGSCSDRYTVEHSGLLDILQPGQRILADKGYTARDLFARKKCFLTIPSFLSDGRLSGDQAIRSRLIASVRIKVENAIKRMKEFKVFSSTLCNRTNKKQVDDMMVIVCALCNLKPKLSNNS